MIAGLDKQLDQINDGPIGGHPMTCEIETLDVRLCPCCGRSAPRRAATKARPRPCARRRDARAGGISALTQARHPRSSSHYLETQQAWSRSSEIGDRPLIASRLPSAGMTCYERAPTTRSRRAKARPRRAGPPARRRVRLMTGRCHSAPKSAARYLGRGARGHPPGRLDRQMIAAGFGGYVALSEWLARARFRPLYGKRAR